jgi:IS605 OrfB family transposase
MIKAHKIRLNPTPGQAIYFAKAAGTARFAYNWGLAEWKRQHEAGEKPSALGLKKQFNAIKRDQFPWVYDVTKCAVEQAFVDLGQVFSNFFAGRADYRQFKRKHGSKASFYVANDKFTVGDHWVKLPHIGKVNLAETLRLEGKILSARISQQADWWFIAIQVEMPDRAALPLSEAVGIDLGLLALLTLSTGERLESQKPLKGLQRKLKRAQRKLSRCQKGGHNREKARMEVARLHYRVTCKWDDILHKATTGLAEKYGLICLENLNVKGMMQNHCLAEALGDAAFGKLVDLLESKVLARGGHIQYVDRFFPSSKRCSGCGAIRDNLTLSDRIYCCPQCGLVLDRDHNAAINILKEGIRLWLGTGIVDTFVREASPSSTMKPARNELHVAVVATTRR